MMKCRAVIFFLATVCLPLCGCGTQTAEGGEKAAYARCAETSEYHMAETEQGFYMMSGGYLYYADKTDVSKWMPVCSKPNCTHDGNTEGCDAALGGRGFRLQNGRVYFYASYSFYGGDGGVAKELIKYPSVEHIDVVETDKMFVDVCRRFFPEVACGLEDERISMFYDDGLRFLRRKHDEYDLIINDSTDPLGHTEGLFTKEFYGSCYKALKDDGIMVYQHGSPFYDEDELECRKMHRKVYKSFPISLSLIHI